MEPEITCTHAEANYEQLVNCKTTLGKLNGSFEQMTKLLSIAGNEVRLKILYLLDMETELCPCDLADILGMSMSAVSQHIRKIKDAGFIVSRRDGQTLYYSLVKSRTQILDDIFATIDLYKKPA